MDGDDPIARHNADLQALLDACRGADVAESERLVRAFAGRYQPYLREIDIAFTARAFADPRWARRHPVAALALARRFRHERPGRRSLRQLWRPRFAG